MIKMKKIEIFVTTGNMIKDVENRVAEYPCTSQNEKSGIAEFINNAAMIK